MKEHADDLRKRSKASVLYNHIENHHPEVKDKATFEDFEFLPNKKFRGPLARQAAESAEIMEIVKENEKKSKIGGSQTIILNSKSEFHQPAGLVKAKTINVLNDEDARTKKSFQTKSN